MLGDPVTVVEDVMMKPSGAANYAVSRPGTLVYVPGGAVEPRRRRSLVWVDRKGHEEPIEAPLAAYGPPRLSPDGTRVAIGIRRSGEHRDLDLGSRAGDVEAIDLLSWHGWMPLWTPDGRRIIFMSARAGVLNLYSQAVDGAGTVDRLTTSANPQWPTSITRDGTRLFGFEIGPKIDARSHPGSPDRIPRARASAPRGPSRSSRACSAGTSPRSRRTAAISRTSRMNPGGWRSTCDRSRRWTVTAGRSRQEGGTRPAWARSGRELFYLDESSALTVVPVQTSGPTFMHGSPATVFDTEYVEPNPARHYDVSPDGQRFLMLKDDAPRDPNATPASMVVVEHWFEELKSRVR